jgi:hypothetical protein
LLNNSENFREELLRSFRNVVAGEVGGKDAAAVRGLLNLIAMVQPVDTADPNFKADQLSFVTQPSCSPDHFNIKEKLVYLC